jgi:hypothetical protein
MRIMEMEYVFPACFCCEQPFFGKTKSYPFEFLSFEVKVNIFKNP